MIKLEPFENLLLIILEPGNFTKLKQGDPIILNPDETGLNKALVIQYTPDAEWLAGELQAERPDDMRKLAATIVSSLSRKEVDRAARAN